MTLSNITLSNNGKAEFMAKFQAAFLLITNSSKLCSRPLAWLVRILLLAGISALSELHFTALLHLQFSYSTDIVFVTSCDQYLISNQFVPILHTHTVVPILDTYLHFNTMSTCTLQKQTSSTDHLEQISLIQELFLIGLW